MVPRHSLNEHSRGLSESLSPICRIQIRRPPRRWRRSEISVPRSVPLVQSHPDERIERTWEQRTNRHLVNSVFLPLRGLAGRLSVPRGSLRSDPNTTPRHYRACHRVPRTSVVDPARQAYSHSASVGRRNKFPAAFSGGISVRRRQNSSASIPVTDSTGFSPPWK